MRITISNNEGDLLEMKIMTKNVRISDDLIARIDAELSRTGRTRNAELVALLEEAIIEMKYSRGYALTDPELITEDESIVLSGGGSYQIRIPQPLERIIVDNVPGLIEFTGETRHSSETFSEKVRYLLLRGLSSRGAVVAVELESISGGVYQDEDIEKKFITYKKGDNPKLDQMILLGEKFEEFMKRTQGNVLLFGATGTGKSFCAGFYKTANKGECHFLDLMPQGMRSVNPRRVILLWSNDKKYNDNKTLILDDAHCLDNDYLNIFLKKSERKNVRVVLTCHCESVFDKDVLESIDHKLNCNWNKEGNVSWVSEIQEGEI
ncbi:ATP-binding protein (plasmid) [Klebsiella pneumoniae]|uniref:ATP-binding protein n=1 Tax=Klebsiella pneumoniae TaxID=573 RepID=UPI001FAE5C72|nr:ATP-binding protein [Klebsiella pneumoniae]MCI8109337.1 ATP-binding protein [Klebsiella pneumoniae]